MEIKISSNSLFWRMLSINELRIGNCIFFLHDYVILTAIGEDNQPGMYMISFRHLTNDEIKGGQPIGSMALRPVPLTIDLIKQLHFVPHGEKMEHVSGPMEEYTDGRVILRFHSEGVSVFTPIDMPWATVDFPLQSYYITSINNLHQLQNLYFDLFKEELELSVLT